MRRVVVRGRKRREVRMRLRFWAMWRRRGEVLFSIVG